MTENELRQSVVSIMMSWVGAREGDATHKSIIDGYNQIVPLPRGHKMTYAEAWCAATVSEAGHRAGLLSIMPAECSCNKLIEAYKSMGRWVEDDNYIPSPGDLVLYDWQDGADYSGDNTGKADHVGMVAAVSGNVVTVIEGNVSDQVWTRNLTVNGRYIRGYCVPDFASLADLGASAWANESTRKAVQRGVFQGDGNSYRWQDPVTREQLAAVLDRLGLLG